MQCVKCNCFGHVTEHCKGKVCCSTCSVAQDCTAVNLKCNNCGGNHLATSKHCPRYIKKSQILKIKAAKKLSYTKACIEAKLINQPANYQITQTH